MRIFTHMNMDLDAHASVWAVLEFISGASSAEIVLVPASWDGDGFSEGDLAVDLEAGGHGMKGRLDDDGTRHSSFAWIVEQYAPIRDQEALRHLVEFVDAQDSRGSTVDFFAPKISRYSREVLAFTGLNAVHRALQSVLREDLLVFKRMSEIFDGMLRTGHARLRAVDEAKRAEILEGGKVAIVTNSTEFGTNSVLFEDMGVRFIVYVDGNNIGVIRRNKLSVRADAPEIRAVVRAAGEEDEWFAHSSGFLFCRGSRKAPRMTPSRVDPRSLAEAAVRAMNER